MKLKNAITLLLIMGIAFTSFAQEEKSAASLYNEGLALLKAKDYAAGLPLIESSLEKATLDKNEKIINPILPICNNLSIFSTN